MIPDTTIAPARSPDDLAAIECLFRAYAASLPIALDYQDFDGELASLPGKYAPPHGALLLARDAGGEAIGCIALRPMDEAGCCEMKRLYVAPAGRGSGIGGGLVTAVIGLARQAGYREMWLDTLPTMHAALALYRAAGFVTVERYYDTPVEETVFLRLTL